MQFIICRMCGALHSHEEAGGNCAVCKSHLRDFAGGFVDARREGAGFVVSRYFTSEAAAQRGLNLLLSVNEAAFDSGATQRFGIGGKAVAYDAHPGSLNLPSNEDGS